jgi:hypothetical protein
MVVLPTRVLVNGTAESNGAANEADESNGFAAKTDERSGACAPYIVDMGSVEESILEIGAVATAEMFPPKAVEYVERSGSKNFGSATIASTVGASKVSTTSAATRRVPSMPSIPPPRTFAVLIIVGLAAVAWTTVGAAVVSTTVSTVGESNFSATSSVGETRGESTSITSSTTTAILPSWPSRCLRSVSKVSDH